MSEETFRLVITAAVILACIAFGVQAMVALAFYRTARKVQQKVDDLALTVEPLIGRIGPVIDKATPIIERLGPILDRSGDTIERIGPVIDQTAQVIRKIGGVVEQAGPVVENVRLVLANANQVVSEVRPRIAEISEDAVSAVRSGREQVEHIGDLLNDATGRARARLEQVDRSVENTVEQVGQVGDAVKRVAMRPVREANGIAAGISAAMSTLVKGPRKSSPDSATQDEEMFI